MTTTIELEYTGRGKFQATLDGEPLLDRPTRTPVFGSCRVLAARGISGRLEWRHGSGPIAGHVASIAAGAKLTISEAMGLKVVPWAPFNVDRGSFGKASREDGQLDPDGTQGANDELAVLGVTGTPANVNLDEAPAAALEATP